MIVSYHPREEINVENTITKLTTKNHIKIVDKLTVEYNKNSSNVTVFVNQLKI